MLPRLHSARCTRDEFPKIKKRLQSQGYEVYDAFHNPEGICYTYALAIDVNAKAFEILGDPSEENEPHKN